MIPVGPEFYEQTAQLLEQSDGISRRAFLSIPGKVAGVVGAAVLVAACAPEQPRERQGASSNAIPVTSTPTEILTQGGKDKLIKALNNLPESPLKEALVGRVLPYFQTPTPFESARSGFPLRVSKADVNTYHWNALTPLGSGVLSLWGLSDEPFHAQIPISTALPLPYLINSDEASKLSPINLARDKTLVDTLILKQEDGFFVGLAPQIRVYRLSPEDPRLTAEGRVGYDAWEQYSYIKESCSLLLADVYLEEVYKKSVELGYSTTLRAKDNQGNIEEVEILSAFLFATMKKGNRIQAVLDLAGYLLGLKALEGTEILSLLKKSGDNVDATSRALSGLNLGSTPQSILSNSFEAAIRNPNFRALHHQGSLDKIVSS